VRGHAARRTIRESCLIAEHGPRYSAGMATVVHGVLLGRRTWQIGRSPDEGNLRCRPPKGSPSVPRRFQRQVRARV